MFNGSHTSTIRVIEYNMETSVRMSSPSDVRTTTSLSRLLALAAATATDASITSLVPV